MKKITAITKISNQQGVGIIEVLVAMMVVAIGVLGLGALHLHATRASGESAYYSQAAWVVNDLVNRMQKRRPATFSEYQELIDYYNTSSEEIYGDRESLTNNSVPRDFGCRTAVPQECDNDSCTQRQQIIWDFWDAGCPSINRANTQGEIADDLVISKPLDWFVQPKVTVFCRAKQNTNFYQTPTGNEVADCTVMLSWAVRANKNQATDLTGKVNRSNYFVQFELGR